MNRSILFLQALGESLGKGDDHKDMDIITKFLKVCTFWLGKGDTFSLVKNWSYFLFFGVFLGFHF